MTTSRSLRPSGLSGATGTVTVTAQVSPLASLGSLLANRGRLDEPGMFPVDALAQTLVVP